LASTRDAPEPRGDADADADADEQRLGGVDVVAGVGAHGDNRCRRPARVSMPCAACAGFGDGGVTVSAMHGRLALDEQLGALRQVLSRNQVLVEVLGRAASLGLPGWYLTAGCVFQTVWNVVTGRSPAAAIDSFAATTCCVGIRLEPDGRWRIYAPHGLAGSSGRS